MFTLDRKDLVHGFKYEVWKHSMYLRAMVDLFFAIFLTLFFQWGLIEYNKLLSQARAAGIDVLTFGSNNMGEEYADSMSTLEGGLTLMSQQLNLVMYASYINLLFPLNLLMGFVFSVKANRKEAGFGFDEANELVLFIVTIICLFDMKVNFPVLMPENRL